MDLLSNRSALDQAEIVMQFEVAAPKWTNRDALVSLLQECFPGSRILKRSSHFHELRSLTSTSATILCQSQVGLPSMALILHEKDATPVLNAQGLAQGLATQVVLLDSWEFDRELVIRTLKQQLRPGDSAPTATRQRRLLTRRQLQIADLIAQGCSNADISETLGIAESTIRIHVSAILRNLRLANRTQIAMWLMRNRNLLE